MYLTSLIVTEATVLGLQPNGDFLVITLYTKNPASGENYVLEIPILQNSLSQENLKVLEEWAGMPQPVSCSFEADYVVLAHSGCSITLETAE
jgi:hypothetical protein